MNPTEWKIVPKIPTPDMIYDGVHMCGDTAISGVPVYDAMIAAAPPSPFVMVAREDLAAYMSIGWKVFDNNDDFDRSVELRDRLTQALETQPQAEG